MLRCIIITIIIGFSFLSTPLSLATSLGCDQLSSFHDILTCALENDPEIRQSKIMIEQGNVLSDIAKQIPNPEFYSKVVSGNTQGQSVINTEVNLAFPIELGGKRQARNHLANSEKKILAAHSLGTKEGVYRKTLIALYRIRQIRAELAAIHSILNAYSRIRSQYRLRPKLAPEQQVALQTFDIAFSEYKLRESSLETEAKLFLHDIEHSIGRELIIKELLLPPPKKNWPILSESELEKPAQGYRLQNSEAELRRAQSELFIAESQAWPDLKIGPTVEQQTQGPITFFAIGGHLTLTLPVFNLNGSRRAYATIGVLKAEQDLLNQKNEDSHQREYLLSKYKNAVHALNQSLSLEDAHRKQGEIETLFHQGLVSASIFIEAHRQFFDFIKGRNEQELTAIDALVQFYAYQGKLFQGNLSQGNSFND